MGTGQLVSVIVPVFNGERYLSEAIDSVLTQRHRPLEILVVDDGSTDGTAAVAQRFRDVRYVRQDHAGQAEARNRGLRLAQGEFIAFLDADDVWTADKLELQLAVLAEDASVDLVFGHAEQFLDVDAPNTLTLPDGRRILPARVPSALLARREAVDRVGEFSSQWAPAEVVDWVARAMEHGLRAVTLDDVVFRRRLHAANLGVTTSGSRTGYLGAVGAALSRRRLREPREPPAGVEPPE